MNDKLRKILQKMRKVGECGKFTPDPVLVELYAELAKLHPRFQQTDHKEEARK